MVFRGITSINLDNKGRIIIPTRYRSLLENSETMVITIDSEDKCLLLYPLNIWEEIEIKIANLPSFNPLTRKIQRLLIGHATEVNLDNNGRLLLPPLLRTYAEIDKQIMLVGQGKKFEIWSKTMWENCRAEWLKLGLRDDNMMPNNLQTLSL